MNNDRPIPNSLTRQLTEFPEYKAKEEHSAECPCKHLWQRQEQLAPEALNSIAKVESALETAEAGMNVRLFDNLKIQISVVNMRTQIIRAEVAATLPRFHSESQLLSRQIIEITKQIKEAAQESASFEEKRAAILIKLEKTAEALIDFRDTVMIEKKELESLPLAKDPRTLKKNIRPFDKLGLHHQTYLKQVQEWKLQQVLVCEASEIDCWKWKGKNKSIKILEAQCVYLENSLHAAECCLTALKSNVNNEQFRQRASAREEAYRVFMLIDPSIFGMGANIPSAATGMPSPFSFGSSFYTSAGMPPSNPFGSSFRSGTTGAAPASNPFKFSSPSATATMPSSNPFGSSFQSGTTGAAPSTLFGSNASAGTILSQEEQQQLLYLIITLAFYQQVSQNLPNNGK